MSAVVGIVTRKGLLLANKSLMHLLSPVQKTCFVVETNDKNRSIAGREALRYYFDGQLEISSNAPVKSSVAEIQAFILGAGFIKMLKEGS